MQTSKLVGWIFATTGVVLLAGAAFIYQSDAIFAARARSASGEVVELVRSSSRDSDGDTAQSYASRIRFTTEDDRPIEFVETISSNPPRHAPGEQVRLLYDPATPSHAIVDDFWGRRGLLVIFTPLGVLFAALGIFLSTATLRRARRRARLLRSGRQVEAEFLQVFEDRSLRINGRYPFRVVAQANDPVTGKLRRFESPPIWVDPTSKLEGTTVKILLDRLGQRYLMELTDIVDPSAYA